MYIVSKRMEIAGSHYLRLDYDSPCCKVHGHNWIIQVWCRSPQLDQNGMVIDFAEVKRQIHGQLDHQSLNQILVFNPTAENLAEWIAKQIGPKCFRVEVQESEGNVAIWEV